jgi:GlpG protein
MIETDQHNQTPNELTAEPLAGGSDQHQRPAIVTSVAFFACLAVFLFEAIQPDAGTPAALERVGWRDSFQIWGGAWWALVTSAFVHAQLWHVGGNLYWMWQLGAPLERVIGVRRMLVFLLTSAFVSSAMQLAVSGNTGIGFSGVCYALLGPVWMYRKQYPEFAEAHRGRAIALMWIWLVACIAATWLIELPIGNTAHVSGLIFGLAASPFLLRRSRWRVSAYAALLLCVLSIIPLVWAPWQVGWIAYRATSAFDAKDYETSVRYSTQFIEQSPDPAWGYAARSAAYGALGRDDLALADWETALRLDPALAN